MSTYVRHVLQAHNEICTSPFGDRKIVLNGRVLNGHNGMDFIPEGYIVTPEAGTVIKVKDCVPGVDTSGNNDWGNYVRIKVNNTYVLHFAHMKLHSITVKEGDKVKAGQVIGYMGTTGYSTGVHLHFGIMKNGTWIDPEPYMNGTMSLGPSVQPTPKTGITVGSVVKVRQGAYYANTTTKTKVPTWVCKNEYTVDEMSADGTKALLDSSGLNSWVYVKDLILVSDIKVGDMVQVRKGAYYANTFTPTKVPDWVCQNTYRVDALSADKVNALLDSSGLNSWVAVVDLKKV